MSKGSYLDEKCDNCLVKSKDLRLLHRFQGKDGNSVESKVTLRVCESCYPNVIAGSYWKSSL
jgi:hypothetical protein